MKVYLSDARLRNILRQCKELLLLVQRNWRLVSLEKLRHFCGVPVSLTLAVPLARFYTRSIYFDMSRAERYEDFAQTSSARSPVNPRLRMRLSWQSMRDLRY